ncbi:integrin alpha-9 [Rhipicephalus sanguineus]|uniref:integrin alpha-9 n=1 Tax=Rhipicephalus sanguineus TaxID=34632 RepID=UPI00189556E2|nr:integrin alpha-9 [Rhipicephalus sanguineus]
MTGFGGRRVCGQKQVIPSSAVFTMAAWRWTASLLLLCACCLSAVSASNLDTGHATTFVGQPGSHFGYTVELIINRDGKLALVSAIKGNSTTLGDDVHQPGALFKCRPQIERNQCTEVRVDTSDKGEDAENEADGEPFHDLHDNMHLGMSMLVQPGPDGRVIVCAPKWKNQLYKKTMYMLNGICYVLDHDLAHSDALRPLLRRIQQVVPPNADQPDGYYYAVAEFGFSADVSTSNELLVGAPGLIDWTGSVIKYTIPNDTSETLNLKVRGLLDAGKIPRIQQYIGYSVTSGRFFESMGPSMVAGAPRETEDRKGAVYFFTQETASSNSLRVQMKKEGEQMGSYFGAAVLGIDLNNDNYSDLIVGAPFYSLKETTGDEGKAYVYISNGASLSLQHGQLMGSSVPGARFGITIVNIGDLNLDGYPDVAIGAPYENDHGAVYIYNGGKNGLKTTYSQRIEARSQISQPQGFGISISKALDIDDNEYPDIMIGAYKSDMAYLFRASPIAYAKAWIEIPTGRMSSKTPKCNRNNVYYYCIEVLACMTYSGKFLNEELGFFYELEIDSKRADKQSPRGGFELPNGIIAASVSAEKTIRMGVENCFSEVALIDGNVTDLVTPFEFRLSFDLADNLKRGKRDSFCKECPILDQSTVKVVTNRTAFQVACGADNVCNADLELKASIEGHENNSPLVVGKDSTVTLNVTVKNREEEPAYLAEVEINLPENVDIVNIGSCEKKNSSTLTCDIGNPLNSNVETKLAVKLGLTKLKKKLEVKVFARTLSLDVDRSNDHVLIALPLIHHADIALQGSASISQLIYNKSTDIVPVVHTFTMVKYYDSPINKVAVTISVPLRIVGHKANFMTLLSVIADDGSRTKVGGSCNSSVASLRKRSSSTTSPPITRQRREANPLAILEGHFPAAQIKSLTLDCSGAECMSFTCQMGPFADKNKVAKIELNMIINVTLIMEQVGIPDTVDIISEGSLTILDETEFTHYVKQQPKQAMIVTSLVKEGPPATPSLAWWIYLLIVLGGLLVLLVIILVLYKWGFFKRQAKEDLERSKRESLAASSAPNSPTTEALPSIPSDDPEVRRSLLSSENP